MKLDPGKLERHVDGELADLRETLRQMVAADGLLSLEDASRFLRAAYSKGYCDALRTDRHPPVEVAVASERLLRSRASLAGSRAARAARRRSS